MTQAFKETLASIKDKSYGKIILSRTVLQAIWYWLKYVLFFSITPALIAIAVLTYFIPQIPRLIKDNIAPGEIKIESGKFSTSYQKPIVIGSPDFSIIVDTASPSSNLNKINSGVMVRTDKIIIKSPDSQTVTLPMSEIGDFSLSQSLLLDWASRHQLKLWFLMFGAVLLITSLSTLFYVAYRLTSLFLWTGLFYLIARILKRHYPISSLYKISLYAAVPSLIISFLFGLFPNSIFSALNMGIFIFLSVTWLRNLPPK